MEINIRGYKFIISFSRDAKPSVPPDKVLFDRLHLDGLLRPYFDNKVSLIGILLSQFSVLITIWLTLLVSDIQAKWGIDRDLWLIGTISVFSILGVWSVYIIYKIIRLPSFEQFLANLIIQSSTTQDRRFVFLLTGCDVNGFRRVLVQYSMSWQCWLLPNFPRSQSIEFTSPEKLIIALNEKLGARAGELRLSAIEDDLISSKQSFKNGKFTSYYFDFYKVLIDSDALELRLCDLEFEIGGNRFRWMTIGDMKLDANTRERNSDVINHLEDRIFGSGSSFQSIKAEIRVS